MNKRFSLFVLLFGFLAFMASPSVQGKIEGVVADKAGKPLEKVTVTIIPQNRIGLLFELKTNNAGIFGQAGLSRGYYQVSFRKPGCMPQWLETRVGFSPPARLEVIMESGTKLGEQHALEADTKFLKGNLLYGEKNYAEAVAAYEEAVKLGQDNWNYYLNLGLAYKKLDKKEDATAALRRAVEINPKSYSAHRELAETLASLDQYVDSRNHYERAAEISPDDPDASFHLGICLLNTLEQEAALRAFQKTVRLKPDYGEAYYHIGTLFIGQNRVKEAVESLEIFLKLAPGSENTATARQLLEFLKKGRKNHS